MQIKTFLAFAVAGAVVAQETKPNLIAEALASIGTALTALDAKISGWDGVDIAVGGDVLTQSEGLLSIISAAEAKVKTVPKEPTISLQEATKVLGPSNALQKTTAKVIDGLISKKKNLDSLSLSGVVGQTLGKFKIASESLLKEVKVRLPLNVQAVGDTIGKKINEALDKGIKEFGS